MNYKLFKVGLPVLLLTNNIMLIYAAYRSGNPGDSYWYLLTVCINIIFMAVHQLSLPPTHNRDKRVGEK